MTSNAKVVVNDDDPVDEEVARLQSSPEGKSLFIDTMQGWLDAIEDSKHREQQVSLFYISF